MSSKSYKFEDIVNSSEVLKDLPRLVGTGGDKDYFVIGEKGNLIIGFKLVLFPHSKPAYRVRVVTPKEYIGSVASLLGEENIEKIHKLPFVAHCKVDPVRVSFVSQPKANAPKDPKGELFGGAFSKEIVDNVSEFLQKILGFAKEDTVNLASVICEVIKIHHPKGVADLMGLEDKPKEEVKKTVPMSKVLQFPTKGKE